MTWEYHKIGTISGTMPVEELNKLGSEGWEHYAIAGNVNFFKREYKGEEERINDKLPIDQKKASNRKK